MWSQAVLFLLVGLAYASTNAGWKDNTEYVYLVRGRTLTSLHDVSDQYSGIFLKAKLYISPRSDGKLQARISEAQYAQIHSQLPEGWNSFVPDSEVSYKELPLSQKPFHMVMKESLIKSLIVEKEIANWEANVIKSIVSQFQLDIQGKNAIYSPMNSLPSGDRYDGVFKTMEETVTGETETSYEIHRLPEYLLQSKPWLVPQLKLKGNGEVIEVIKNKNYTNSRDIPSYHYGFGEVSEWEPTSNRVGQFVVRQSHSRAILTGKLSRFTIQNSYTVNKVLVNPTLNDKEKGSVISMLNVTLSEVTTKGSPSQELSNPIEIGNLVYSFETPFAKSNQVHQKQRELYQYQGHSSEESTERSWQRFRRSAEQMIRKLHSADSSSSEEYVQQQSRPQMNQAPESPLLPYMVGYQGRSIKENRNFDLKQNIQKIAKEIGEELQVPEKLITHSTLSKYAMMCSLVRLMNEEEIKSIAQTLYTQSKEGKERLAWVAYRDAVAEAGTGPTFLAIQQWISSQKIEKLEASQIISTMAYAVRTPTEEYMRKFFELIKTPEVRLQAHLNETALLSYASLINRVYINRNESHNQYPVHSFGRFDTPEGKEFVKTSVIPYLSQQLHDAISQADSRKIHVYIRALGNVGHKMILEVFEPYLEGQKQCSQFQRMLMVLCLDKLVISSPVVARSVLYKIYQNSGEIPEVRVVAVHQLMRTNPPVEMLQRMAEHTNVDSQEHVNAAVKSVIESASQLRSQKAQQLRKSAESAKPLLTRKTYGKQRSVNYLQDFIIENMNLEFKENLLKIGNSESYWPKGVQYSVRGNLNGMKHYFFNTQAMISSIRELTNVMYQQTEQFQQSKHLRSQQSGESKWFSANIAQSLNLQLDEKEQLEGFIYTEMESLQKLWSFDNGTIEQLPEFVREQEELFKNGKKFRYAKLKQIKEMALSIPTEMGLPFLYTYDMPLLVKTRGSIRAIATPQIYKNQKLGKPEQISIQIDAYVTTSAKVQSHLSVVTPFDHQVYTSGFDRNVHAHLPIKAYIEVDVKNMESKIEFEIKDTLKDARLLHYSSWPFTSRDDLMSITPVALRPNTRIIKPQQHDAHRSFDFVYGKKQTGMSFRAWGHHPQQHIKLIELFNTFQSEGVLSVWQKFWDQSSSQHTEANIAFVPSQSSTRKLTIRLGYQQQYKNQPTNQGEEGFLTLDQLSSKVHAEPSSYKKFLFNHVGAGIKSAQLYSYDASLEFDGDQKYQHIFTVAAAKSNVSPLSKIVVYYKNNAQQELSQCAIQLKGYVSNTNALDLTYSLNTEPKANYQVRVQCGKNEEQASKVKATVELSRSPARKQYLKENALFYVCKKQMQEGNYQLTACQNLTIQSNFFDQIQIELKHENFRKSCSSSIDALFKGIRFMYYPITEIKDIQTQEPNKINVKVQFQPETLRQVNVTIRASDEETKMYNISMNEMMKTIVVPHPVFNAKVRVMGEINALENFRPTCVIDQTAAQTFSNKTYPLSLGNGWTLMMQYIPLRARLASESRQDIVDQLKRQHNNFAVLVREESSQRREVMITFNNPQTEQKIVEVTMKPTQPGQYSGSNPAAMVMVDGQEIKFNDKESADLFNGYVQIYALPNGEVKFEIIDWFYVIFDGERVELTATNENLRESVVGLCGRFTDDQQEDFLTPENCIARDWKKFVQSYNVESSKQLLQKGSNEWQQECIPKVLPLYADVISDRDAGRQHLEHSGQDDASGTRLRYRYVEENGEICFSIRPVPVCKHLARTTVMKNVPVHCVQKSKTAYYLKNQIDKGGNPDFSKKPETKTVEMEVHQQCN